MLPHRLGIYEKALPKNISWQDRLSIAKVAGFDFVELSIDETEERLARLDWTKKERYQLVKQMIETGIHIPSMCFSAQRRFPFGSHDEHIRQQSRILMQKAIDLAVDLGIRTIQLAGYDVYYEESDSTTLKYFQSGLEWAVNYAAGKQVTLSVEIMDTQFMSSISRWKKWDDLLSSPWFTVYPDIGNLSAWNDNITTELQLGIDKISAIHLKDTLKVTPDYPGKFRDVPFGEGCVDFLQIFKTLKELNYRGTFLIEMWSEKSPEPLIEIIKARQWIQSKMLESGLC